MSFKKTLGGDRLGSGKKMQVELHGYERSTHDLSYIWRSTMSAGTLVPFMSEVALPGDSFDIDLDCDIKTHPTIGPLFGSYKVQLDVFQAPIRLYHALLHNNALGIGMKMKEVYLPFIEMKAVPFDIEGDVDNSQINPSCLLSYLGLRGVGRTLQPESYRKFNAVPLLAYWEIYKNYYANKAEQNGAVIHTPNVALVNTVTSLKVNNVTVTVAPSETNVFVNPGDLIALAYTGAQAKPEQIYLNTSRGLLQLSSIGSVSGGTAGVVNLTANSNTTGLVIFSWRYRQASDLVQVAPEVVMFPLEYIDKMRENILASSYYGDPGFSVNTANLIPYNFLTDETGGILPTLASQEGLGVKTYQSDLFNAWVDTEWIDGTTGINAITSIDVTSGEFTIDTLNLAKKVYDMLNRIAVSGGSYNDWLEAAYGHNQYMLAESPMYMGGLIKELVFQEVVSNAAAEGQDLGTLAGKGIMAKKHKGGKVNIKVDEPSYIIGIISLTPRVDYSQGNKWDLHLKTMDDLHKPGLDEIGFQDLITEQMAWWDTTWNNTTSTWEQKSAGKQPAWMNYMTNVNRTYGNFAIESNEMFMTLNRRYEYVAGTIGDLTTYIDPVKFNFIFAETSIDAQNFWAQIAVDITARRKMSAKVMPNL